MAGAKKVPDYVVGIYDRTVVLSTIAQDRAKEIIEAEPEYRRLQRRLRGDPKPDPADLRQFMALSRKVVADSLIAIAFAGMALESCLYSMIFQMRKDDVSTLLNESRFRTLDRWRVLLWLLTGEFLTADAPLYGALKRTIKARDTVIHSKPQVLKASTAKERLNKFDVVNEAKHAVDTMRDFERYLHGFHINLAYTLLKI